VAVEITPPRIEGRITVRDGRKLSFAEFGPVGGRPLVWLHGTPGARRQIPESARLAAADLGLRIVGIDRPGVGLSTPHQYASILDFAADLEIVVDELGFDAFALIGLSGGGPYALAAAYAMPGRVPVVGVLGGVVPTVGEDAVAGGLVGAATRLAPILPALQTPASIAFTALIRVARPVASNALDLYARFSPEGDRRVFSRPEIKAMFIDDLVGNSRRGLRAPAFDVLLFTRDWGFRLGDVRVPVRWWHGDADHIVPLRHGRAAVAKLPDAELYVRPGESHLGGFAAAEEVLDTLLEVWDTTPG
jgi:pimeloyl-ACP methyl ester carboxylesterase